MQRCWPISGVCRVRHDSEIQGGRGEQFEQQAPPGRGASTPGMGGGGERWEVQVDRWRDNTREMEDFEMEMDS